MNALRGHISVHTTVRTLLEATHAAVGLGTGCLQMAALVMVSEYRVLTFYGYTKHNCFLNEHRNNFKGSVN